MFSFPLFRLQAVPMVGLILLSQAVITPSAKANVYATNLRLNNATTNLTVASGDGFAISYILNEPATAGVTIQILNSNTPLRTLVITNGAPGSLAGTNLVVWDGKAQSGLNPAGGNYSVAVTAASSGYDDWTQISSDANEGNYVWEPRGIAVNKNPSSLYYGRVYVANASEGPHPESNPGDMVGMQKLNSDGSPAAEGIFSTGGYPWAGDFFSPWKLDVAADDVVYINDWTGNGVVVSLDPLLSTNSLKYVLRSDNWPNFGVNLSGPAITGAGTNTQVWMADNTPGSVGIRRWNVGPGGVIATNDVGTTIVQAGAPSTLTQYPYDVALDNSNRIYTIQNRVGAGDPEPKLMRFPAYSGTTETNADWSIGSGDDSLRNLVGVAVDPSATYVAVASRGVTNQVATAGGVRIFSATNGLALATLENDEQTDVAWDNAGNVYSTDNAQSVWRAYSPPGTNQATTIAIQSVQILPPPLFSPLLSAPQYANGQFQFTLSGISNATYLIQASSNLVTWSTIATNTSVDAIRTVTASAPFGSRFFRAQAVQHIPPDPLLSQPYYSGGQFFFTLTGEPNVSYVIFASSDLSTSSWTAVLTNVSPQAVRSISVTAPPTQRFYRASPGP